MSCCASCYGSEHRWTERTAGATAEILITDSPLASEVRKNEKKKKTQSRALSHHALWVFVSKHVRVFVWRRVGKPVRQALCEAVPITASKHSQCTMSYTNTCTV